MSQTTHRVPVNAESGGIAAAMVRNEMDHVRRVGVIHSCHITGWSPREEGNLSNEAAAIHQTDLSGAGRTFPTWTVTVVTEKENKE